MFTKGNKLGHGRPKGGKDYAVLLLEAIKNVEKDKKIKYLQFAVERSLQSDKILSALLSKLVPDLSKSDFGQETIKSIASLIHNSLSSKDL